jgi:DNA-binding NarL/FixJ family response regulator
MIRVLIADDQRVVRDGLSLVLGLIDEVEVVGTAADGEQAVRRAGELRPDVVLMDLRMPHCDGVEATRRLRAVVPDTKVVVLTTYADDRSVLSALRAGARGYLTKDAGRAEIRQALLDVRDDRAALDPAVQQHVIAAVSGRTVVPAGGLSPREHEVLRLVADGMTNAEIAERLVISEATVKTHVAHVLVKVGARDRAHAVARAYRDGLL